jgi:hypothetical protein
MRNRALLWPWTTKEYSFNIISKRETIRLHSSVTLLNWPWVPAQALFPRRLSIKGLIMVHQTKWWKQGLILEVLKSQRDSKDQFFWNHWKSSNILLSRVTLEASSKNLKVFRTLWWVWSTKTLKQALNYPRSFLKLGQTQSQSQSKCFKQWTCCAKYQTRWPHPSIVSHPMVI